MDVETLLERLQTVPDTTGRLVVSRDDFHGVANGEDVGYCVQATVRGSVLSGRGLTIPEACEALKKKLDVKFPV